MEAREMMADLPGEACIGYFTLEVLRQHALGRPTPHRDDRLDGAPFATDEQATISLDEPTDAQIDVRTEPPVQSHPAGTVHCPTFHIREVKEAQIHWLLDLVSVRPGPDHPGDVGLVKLECVGRRCGCRRPT
jgi:hypothetical protein